MANAIRVLVSIMLTPLLAVAQSPPPPFYYELNQYKGFPSSPSTIKRALFSGKKGDTIVLYGLVKPNEGDTTKNYWAAIMPGVYTPLYLRDSDDLGLHDSIRIVYSNIPSETIRKLQDIAIQKARDIKVAREWREYDASQKKLHDKFRADSISAAKHVDSITTYISKKYSQYGVVVTDWEWDYEHEYSYAADVSVNILNPTKKRIKYIWFTFIAFDAVDGRLTNFGSTSVTVKGIGPVEPMDTGSWDFERVFASKVIDKMKLSQVKVLYFDGTTKILNSNSPAILD